MTRIAVEPPSVRRLSVAVALVLGPLAVFAVLRRPAEYALFGPPSDAVGVALVLVAILPLVLLEARPRAAIVLISVGVSAVLLTGHHTTFEALAILLGVGLCAYRAGRGAAVLAVLAGVVGIAVAPALSDTVTPLSQSLANGLLVVIAAMAGLSARSQRSSAIQLEQRSRELEQRSRELEELRAAENREIVAQERLRIAREVHDVVGHALAAIALHARVGTRRVGRDPSGTARSLEEITELAASALAETRDAVGQLRTTDGADLQPHRSLEDLDELVAAFRASDVTVSLRREGEGPPVPTLVQSAAYRIVQESLSNVVRHVRPPATATVLLRREPQALLVDVSDDGKARARPGVPGHGLVGMHERASGLGGTLEAGPGPDGGWQVRATLPTGPLPA
jgi:signal transduction histidine kinase